MNIIEALSIFGISSLSEETSGSLKRRYRVLAKERHPDTAGGGSEAFVALQEAYVILKKEVKPGEDNGSLHRPKKQGSNKQSYKKGYVVVDNPNKQKEEVPAKPKEESVRVVVATSKELQALSKDQLIEQTRELQERIGNLMSNYELHRSVLYDVEAQVQQISEDYRSQLSTLQKSHQKTIDRLDNNPLYRFWVRYIVSPFTGRDIWQQYQDSVASYKKAKQSVKSEFDSQLLELYGSSLNEMTKYLTSSEEL